MRGLSAAVPCTDQTSVACTKSLSHVITSAGVEVHDARAWAKLRHVQRAQNFWADDQTVREFTALTSPRQRRQRRLICASHFNWINSAAGGVCWARWVSEGLDRGLEVGMLPCLRIQIRVSKNEIANETKNMSSKLQYALSHAANYVTVKHVIASAVMIVDAKWQTRTKCDSHITGKLPSSENGVTQANTLMSPRRTGGQRWVRQCSGHVYRLDLLLRQQQNAFDPIVIIIELSYRIVYRDNFDLSYRLSIGNSIWHIVTALLNIDVVLRTAPSGGKM